MVRKIWDTQKIKISFIEKKITDRIADDFYY